ncbi:MAG: hypothetical protein PVJ80_07265 [Gemmatimonadota bacterium]|jgi:hypothetical protein
MSRSVDGTPGLHRGTLATLLALSAFAGCDMPAFEGPQLQDPPQGFLLQPDSRDRHPMFAYLQDVYHDAWVQSVPPHSTIRINGYTGTLTVADVIVAQDSMRAHPDDPEVTFGDIEPLTIDGREAWGWEERIQTQSRGLPWVAYRVMVPYDTISYTIELETADPLLKPSAPGSLKDIISTFAVGETVYNWPLMAIGIGLLLFALHMLRERSRAKTERLQSINLVKIEKKPDEQEREPGEEPAKTEPTSAE